MSATIDLPFERSRPLQLTGFNTAALVGGAYNFTTQGKLAFTPGFNFSDNSIYVLTNFTLFANVPEEGWIAGLRNPPPQVNLFMSAKDSTPILESPITFAKYYEQYEYIKMFYPRATPNVLLFSIRGSITQTAFTAGYPSIMAGFVITLYEVKDAAFIKKFGGAQ